MVSSLIVAFPVFLYVSWVTTRAIKADPNKRASKVRRWLTYLTLFIAVIAGTTFGYYLSDLRVDETETRP